MSFYSTRRIGACITTMLVQIFYLYLVYQIIFFSELSSDLHLLHFPLESLDSKTTSNYPVLLKTEFTLTFVSILHSLYTGILSGFTNAEENETTVRQMLLKNYDKSLSPIIFQKKIFYTYMWLTLLRIRGLDESKGEFILEGMLATVWSDERLSWESDTVNRVRVSSDDVWMPHMMVLNRVEKEELTLNPIVFVFHFGVGWGPRYVFRTICIPNLKFFPFDKQKCDVIVNSISDEGDILPTNYSSPEFSHNAYINTGYMVENNLWKLLSAVATRKQMEVEIDAVGYGGVYTFEIERTMPLIALGILSPSLVSLILLLSTFWMRAGTPTRTGMSATSILVSAGNLFTIGRILPVSGATTPIIVEYVTSALILSMISALQAIAVSVMSRCRKQPPLSYAKIIAKFPKWVLVMLVLVPKASEVEGVDQTFLFSELVETDDRHLPESEGDPSMKTNPGTCPWEKHIVLFDRLVFYIFGIVIGLLIVSVIFTE